MLNVSVAKFHVNLAARGKANVSLYTWAAILRVKLGKMFATVMSLKYALSVS